jgi:hypothetical protein
MFWIVAFAIIGGFLTYIARKPNTFAVQRETTINARAADIFPWLSNLHRFNEWNPWLEQEPTSTLTYSGPEEGPGASYAWLGKKTGQGNMTVRSQTPPHELSLDLNFMKPIKANNTVKFALSERGGATIVTWIMSGQNNFVAKLFQTFMNMDKMVGKDFEKGLANLKLRVESKKLH